MAQKKEENKTGNVAKKPVAKKKKTQSLSLEQKLKLLTKITQDIITCEIKKQELERQAATLRSDLAAVLAPLIGNTFGQQPTYPTVVPAPIPVPNTSHPTIPIAPQTGAIGVPSGKITPSSNPGAVNPVDVVKAIQEIKRSKQGVAIDRFHDADGNPKSIFDA